MSVYMHARTHGQTTNVLTHRLFWEFGYSDHFQTVFVHMFPVHAGEEMMMIMIQ